MNHFPILLGPALMRPTSTSIGFWISFGPSEEFNNLDCRIEIETSSETRSLTLARLPKSISITNVAENFNRLPCTQPKEDRR